MTQLWLIAGVMAACLLVGVLLALNGYQWFRLRDQQKHYEGMLEQQANAHAERIKSIGAQLRNLPKRKTDRIE
jgi:cytochrome c-type biogenesis protein CcmH/NrfG